MLTQQSESTPQQRLAQATAPVQSQLTFAGGVSVISGLLWVGQAALVAWLFASLVAGTSGALQPLLVAASFILIGAVRAGLDLWADRLVTLAASQVLERERRKLIQAVARRSPLDTARPSSAVIAALAGEKLASLRPYITRYRPAYIRTFVLPLALLVAAASQSWAVGVIFLVAGPLIPMFMALVGMAAQEMSERQMDEISSLNELLMERLQALVDIRLLDAGGAMIDGFRDQAEALRKRTMAVLHVAFLSSAVLELFAALGVAMVALYVGLSLLGDIGFGAYATPLTIGQGVFVLMLAPAYFQPMRDVATAWHDRAAALAVARDLLALETGQQELVPGGGNPADPLPGKVAISVRGLHVSVGDGNIIAYPDFDIAAGQTVALTGSSGVGKSVLLAALGGLISPCAGVISVAGQPLTQDTADGWRARLSWLPQRPHFFSGSLQRNLLPGGQKRDQAKIDAALELAAAKGIVARLPQGLLTRLGEVGAGVSGGEARRLMVARTALEGRDVILADEPTADLDEETARVVSEGLLQLAASGATLIVATHDAKLAARMAMQIDLGGVKK